MKVIAVIDVELYITSWIFLAKYTDNFESELLLTMLSMSGVFVWRFDDWPLYWRPNKLCKRLLPHHPCFVRRGINLSHRFFGQQCNTLLFNFITLWQICLVKLFRRKAKPFSVTKRLICSMAPKPGNYVPKTVEVMSIIDNFSVGFFLIEYTVSARTFHYLLQ